MCMHTVKKWGSPKHPWGTMLSWLLKATFVFWSTPFITASAEHACWWGAIFAEPND